MPERGLYFHFRDAGAFDGETEHRIMCSFYSLAKDGSIRVGQCALVRASEWPTYRDYLERGGWKHREHYYDARGE